MGPGSTTEASEAIAGESALTLVPTFVVVAVDATGMGIILPLLPFYSQRLGATPFLLGAPISVYAVCQLVAGQLIAGPVTAELSRSTAINRQGMIMGLYQSLMSGGKCQRPALERRADRSSAVRDLGARAGGNQQSARSWRPVARYAADAVAPSPQFTT